MRLPVSVAMTALRGPTVAAARFIDGIVRKSLQPANGQHWTLMSRFTTQRRPPFLHEPDKFAFGLDFSGQQSVNGCACTVRNHVEEGL